MPSRIEQLKALVEAMDEDWLARLNVPVHDFNDILALRNAAPALLELVEALLREHGENTPSLDGRCPTCFCNSRHHSTCEWAIAEAARVKFEKGE